MTELLNNDFPRDMCVLRTVVRLYKAERRPIPAREVAAALGMEYTDVADAYANLELGRYVHGARNERTISDHVFGITERALYATGVWPTPETALDRMVAALEAIVENTDDDDTRSRARRVLDGLTGAGKQIGISVATAAITGQIAGS